jgi:hypothetical protein
VLEIAIIKTAGHTTNKNLDLLLQVRRSDMFLDSFGGDITSRTFPVLARLTEEVNYLKCVGEPFLQLVEFLAEKNILLGDVRVEKLEFSFVVLVVERMGDELVEGRAVE